MTPAVRALLIGNIAIYFLMLLTDMIFGSSQVPLSYAQICKLVGFVPGKALEELFIWQFVTYAFVHDGLLHILFNMYVLWWCGTEIERHLGARSFMKLYLAAAVVAVCFQLPYVALMPGAGDGDWQRAVVGASGAIMALLVVFAGLFPDRKIYLLVFGPFSIKTVVFLLMGIDLALMLDHDSDRSHIASAVHIGGALFGFAYLNFRSRIAAAFERLERRLRDEDRVAQRKLKLELDDVLRKINSAGMESLTREERAILNKASKKYRTRP